MIKEIEFSTYRQEILDRLKEKITFSGIREDVALLNGFINSPINTKLSKTIVLGKESIPMVALVGKESGRIYFFSLKFLIPSIGGDVRK